MLCRSERAVPPAGEPGPASPPEARGPFGHFLCLGHCSVCRRGAPAHEHLRPSLRPHCECGFNCCLRHTSPGSRETLNQDTGPGSSALCHLCPPFLKAESSSSPTGLATPVLQPGWPEGYLSLHQGLRDLPRAQTQARVFPRPAYTLLGTPSCS